MTSLEQLREGFLNPPSYYRSAPFWSINDDLQPEVLAEQIRAFHAQGIGGFFFHPRVGISTPYLSERWMHCVSAAVEEARRLGMKAWLYDEDSYPSGFAAGFVPARGKEYRSKNLRWQRLAAKDLQELPEALVRVFRVDGDKLEDVTGANAAALRERGGEYLLFHQVTAGNDTWHNGASYVDTLRPETAQAFLETTHEKYAKRFGDDFGGVIPGIFTDEPRLPMVGGLPWTESFAAYFQAKKGYDLLPHLPSLITETGDYRRIRYDFWDAITHRFIEAWCKPIYEWCAAHKMELTGHFWEHSFPDPSFDGSVMPMYAWEQVPGIDCLFNRYEEKGPYGQLGQFGNVRMVKEVASVAHQLCRPRVISETYGGAGWETTFADMKRIGDWEYVHGVNFLCQHLAHYSLRGCRKRDFPPSFMPHSPWFDSYRLLGDYFGRLSYVLSQGTHVTDLLVLHPATSAWCDFRPGGAKEPLETLAQSFDALLANLTRNHYDYDLGDDILLQEHGRVERDELVLGNCRYRTILVPPHATTLRRSTLELLRAFVANGGKLLAIAPTPALLEGVPSPEVEALFADKQVRRVENSAASLTAALGAAPVSVRDAAGQEIGAVSYQQRRIGATDLFFFTNVSDTEAYQATVRLPIQGTVEEWDPATGAATPLPATLADGGMALALSFAPVGSRLIVVRPGAPLAVAPTWQERQRLSLDQWQISRSEPNALVLDYCRYRIGDGPWSERVYVRRAWEEIRAHYGLNPDRHNTRERFWSILEKMRPIVGDPRVTLALHFNLDSTAAAQSLNLVMETPERFQISVNGQVVSSASNEFWRDRSLRKIAIGQAARQGENEILLVCPEWREDSELETSFLIGDFRVEKRGEGFVLTPEGALPQGDWTAQGYPFYAGSFRYAQEVELEAPNEGEKLFLEVPQWKGAVLRVSVNEGAPILLGWPPYRADITDRVRAGKNRIQVEVVNTLRNLMGPHHQAQLSQGLTAPATFYTPENWSDDYTLWSYGLTGPVSLVREAIQ